MPLLSSTEFRLAQGIAGSLQKLAEWTPDLVKALQEKPTTNHQRQVASLKRQSEAVVSIDETILYINNLVSVSFNQSAIEGFREVERQLKVLRKDLTG